MCLSARCDINISITAPCVLCRRLACVRACVCAFRLSELNKVEPRRSGDHRDVSARATNKGRLDPIDGLAK